MSITKRDGRYFLDFRPNGLSGKRVQRYFDKRTDAVRYQRELIENPTKPVAQADSRTLKDLVGLWYDLHGRSLKSSSDTRYRLLKMSDCLGNPLARLLSSEHIAEYRKLRIDSGISEATLNREVTTLKAMFRELKRLSVIDYSPLFLDMRKLREPRTELSYLTLEQVKLFLDNCAFSSNKSLFFVVRVCLATGARWSEAEGLMFNDCNNNGFTFRDTKNGYSRYVPVDESFYSDVRHYLFVNKSFDTCYGAFRVAFKRSGFEVPRGQLSHILRHTFASHFVMNGGNIKTLQTILGHTSLNTTMKYAHLSRDFLAQAVQYNPLAFIKMDA